MPETAHVKEETIQQFREKIMELGLNYMRT